MKKFLMLIMMQVMFQGKRSVINWSTGLLSNMESKHVFGGSLFVMNDLTDMIWPQMNLVF